MVIETSLPFPNPQPNLRISWPAIQSSQAEGAAFDVLGFAEGMATAFPNVWGGPTGVGTNIMTMRNNILCARFDDTVLRGCLAALHLNPLVTNLAPGYRGIEWQRVYRLTVQLSMDGNLDNGSGVQFGPTTLQVPRFTEGGQGAFGVLGDGAGGWEYVQSDTGAFPGNITDTVGIGAGVVPDATDWNTFEFEIINSAPGRTATFTLTVNGIVIVSRNWVAPLALPLYADVANSTKYMWGARCDTVGVDLFVGPLVIDMGRFTGAGLEILA